MNQKEIFELIKCPVQGIFPCGSRVTCSPPVLDTDEDWMIRIDSKDMLYLNLRLEGLGFELGGSVCINERTVDSPQNFWSFTKGDVNLLITCNLTFYTDFFNATALAKKFNLLAKEDRVMLFQTILYGHCPNPLELANGEHNVVE